MVSASADLVRAASEEACCPAATAGWRCRTTDRQYHIDLAPGELADPSCCRVTQPVSPVSPDCSTPSRSGGSTGSSRRSPGRGAGPAPVGRVHGHRHRQHGDRGRRDPRARPAADAGAHRVLRRAAPGHRAWETSSSRQAAVRLESTTSYYVHDGYPAVADYTAVAALVEAAARLGHTAHVGLTATAPGFYGAQGRPIPQLPIRYPDLAAEMAAQGVVNFEMEASALLVLAQLAGCRAGVVCTAFAQRAEGVFLDRRNVRPPSWRASKQASSPCVSSQRWIRGSVPRVR